MSRWAGKGLGHKHIQDESTERHGFNVASNCCFTPFALPGLVLSEDMGKGIVLYMHKGHVGRRRRCKRAGRRNFVGRGTKETG